MSRKRNKQLKPPVDTGGLDLTLSGTVPELAAVLEYPKEEPAIDVTVVRGGTEYAIGPLSGQLLPLPEVEPAIDVTIVPESRAHAAMEELESILDGTLPPERLYTHCPNDVFADGLTLPEALHQSPFIWIAAAKTNIQGCLLLSNGTRHWTAGASTLEPALFVGVIYDAAAMRARKIWRPVLGNERGWYVNESPVA